MRRIPWAILLLLIFLCQSVLVGCDAPKEDTYRFQSSALASYSIIYEEDNPDYFELANQLADRIYEKYGQFLQVLPDVAVSPGEHEILLGNTNRSNDKSRVMEYSVTVGDGRFIIHVGGTFSAEKAVAFLCEKVFNGQALDLPTGEYYRKVLLDKAYAITDTATARIMTANLLADTFADSAYKPAHYRAEIFAGLLVAYTPDVLGIQETDTAWNTALDEYLVILEKSYGITYTRHLATYEGKDNYTSLLYRSDKFRLEDSGVHVFTWWNDRTFGHTYHMRNISWAQFSPLNSTGKRFIVANTHWSYRTEHADNKTYLNGSSKPIATDELRQQCKNETNTFLTKLKQTKPNVPIFLTGDFNTSLSYFTQSGWTPTSFNIISEEAKKNGTALSTVPTSGHYDHIFGTGKYSINRYALIKSTEYIDLLSDHPFAYVDVSL